MFINNIISIFFSKRKKSQHQIAFYIYKRFSAIYSKFMGSIEDIIYKNNKFQLSFYKEGLFKYKNHINANNLIDNAIENSINRSISIYTLGEKDVEFLIRNIFNNDFRSLIYKITGFKYSIDYLRIYENKHIKADDKQFKNIREAHFDKSFSRNMLKIFIPLNISIHSGPLKVFKPKKNKFKELYDMNSKECNYVLGNGDFLYGVLPNLCWHQEGNPEKDFSSKQIMFQLNPSNRWEFRKDLYLRQLITENKFSSYSSLFFKKKKIIN